MHVTVVEVKRILRSLATHCTEDWWKEHFMICGRAGNLKDDGVPTRHGECAQSGSRSRKKFACGDEKSAEVLKVFLANTD